jgi:type VI secretion system secreted protein VgrG
MARMIELTTPLGDALLFRSLRGKEELARLSEFELSALSLRADIGPGDLLGKNVTVTIELRDGGSRYFDLYVTRFGQGGMVGRYHEYRLTLRPWLWFLTRTSDCRIFQDKTVPDIVKEVFADHSVAVFEDDLTASYSKREYCVQYRETDFDFVSRLLEEEGIYYFLEHSKGRHTLKLVDAYSGHKALEHKATISYYPSGKEIRADEEFIHAWSYALEVQPGAVALQDYDFVKPKAKLDVKAKHVQKHSIADYEIYDYPGEYHESGDGEHYVRLRIDELHSEFERAEADCNVREIAVGRLFNLANAPRKDQEREYLILAAEYDMKDNAYESSPTEGASYACRFTVLQSRQQFRPARITPRPTVGGPQTAVVVGPGGEEIWCDKYGRIKVQFHWDRYGKKNENSSCWIRVSTQWAGGNWGMVSIPRIGQEVVVDFLEGDPDQPIVTGRVYNADQMPPYALPGSATQTGIKSRSSKGAGAANFNEIRFEDKKGSEQLFLHAEKNQDIEVEKDETHWVGQDRKKTVDRDETTLVKQDRTETVNRDETITIHGRRQEEVDKNEIITIHENRTETVHIDETITIHGKRTENVDKTENITIGLDRTEHVKGSEKINIDGSRNETVKGTETIHIIQDRTENVDAAEKVTIKSTRNLDVGSDETIKIGGGRTDSVKNDEGLTVGGTRTAAITGDDIVTNKSLSVTSKETITFTVGAASITMNHDGTIQINGKDISVNGRDITVIGSGDIVKKASGSMTLKARKIMQN